MKAVFDGPLLILLRAVICDVYNTTAHGSGTVGNTVDLSAITLTHAGLFLFYGLAYPRQLILFNFWPHSNKAQYSPTCSDPHAFANRLPPC
jgi:hypothetical protein